MASSTDNIEPLTDLLRDANPHVRLETVMALGEARREDAASALVERFGKERDFQIREALTWATLRVADSSMRHVRRALHDPWWLARLQATHTLSKLGQRSETALLLPLVDDPVDSVASRAYWAVAQCGDPIAVPPLVGQLGRGSSEHRNSLLVALGWFGAEAVGPLAAALSAGATSDVRRHAADTLAHLGAPVANPADHALVDALRDEDEQVRLAALNALGQLTTRLAWDAITQLPSRPGRTGVLAQRLLDDRGTAHILQDDPRYAVKLEWTRDAKRTSHDAVGRKWPPPDLSLVQIEGGPLGERLRPMLAAQVELCHPSYLTRADVPDDVLGRVWDEAYRQAIDAGRFEERARRIAAGAAEQFIHDHVFYEQVSVADPGQTIDQLLFGTGVKIVDFARAGVTGTGQSDRG